MLWSCMLTKIGNDNVYANSSPCDICDVLLIHVHVFMQNFPQLKHLQYICTKNTMAQCQSKILLDFTMHTTNVKVVSTFVIILNKFMQMFFSKK